MYTLNPLFESIGIDDIATIGFKMYNQNVMAKKIMESYPTPSSLKNVLLQTNESRAIKLANMIDEKWPTIIYMKFIKKYLCGSNVLSWLGNLIGSPFSTIYQIFKAINNRNRTGEEILASRI